MMTSSAEPTLSIAVRPMARVACQNSDACTRTTARYPDRKSTRLNSSHSQISYAVFCLKKKNDNPIASLERPRTVDTTLTRVDYDLRVDLSSSAHASTDAIPGRALLTLDVLCDGWLKG